jgi:hypothetical protein
LELLIKEFIREHVSLALSRNTHSGKFYTPK